MCVCVCVYVYLCVCFNTKVGYIYIRYHMGKYTHTCVWSCRLGLQNTPTASLQRDKTRPTSVLDMALNSLMMNL